MRIIFLYFSVKESFKARQGKARQGKARTRQGKARQGKNFVSVSKSNFISLSKLKAKSKSGFLVNELLSNKPS